MTALRVLKIFVEIDCDSNKSQVFVGFRKEDQFYTGFCGNLARGILQEVPSIREVRFERWPSVARDGPLMTRLVKEAVDADKSVGWGHTWSELCD
jgi:hypothetical protein